jgi:hypothetical protein
VFSFEFAERKKLKRTGLVLKADLQKGMTTYGFGNEKTAA